MERRANDDQDRVVMLPRSLPGELRRQCWLHARCGSKTGKRSAVT